VALRAFLALYLFSTHGRAFWRRLGYREAPVAEILTNRDIHLRCRRSGYTTRAEWLIGKGVVIEPREETQRNGEAPAAPAATPADSPQPVTNNGSGLRTRGGPSLLALSAYLAMTYLLFRGAWVAPRTTWIGWCCDPEQGMWFLRWVPYAASHLLNPFYTYSVNYPVGANLMWNTSIPLPSLLMWPVSVTLGPVLAYNIYITLSVALSGWCAYLALRRFTRGHIGPFVGGALYGFSPYLLSQALQHAHLSLIAVPPLLLIMFDEVVVRQRRPPVRMGILLGLLAVAQVLIAEELLAMAGLAGGIALVLLVVMRPRQVLSRLPYLIKAAIAAGVTFAVLAAGPLAVQFLGAERLVGAIHPPNLYVTDLLNFVVPTSVQAIDPPAAQQIVATFTGFEHEDNAYLGAPLLILLCFIAFRLRRSIPMWIGLIVGLGIAVLSLGPSLHVGGKVTAIMLPWSWLARLPLMENILPSRLTLYMYLCAALLLALFLDAFLEGKHAAWATAAALAAAAVALLPLYPLQPYPSWSRTTVPPIFTNWQQSGIADGSVVLMAPLTRDGGGADIMLWQAETGDAFRMPNGYMLVPDANGTALYDTAADTVMTAMDIVQEKGSSIILDAPTRQAIQGDLRFRHVDAVIVGPMKYYDQMVAFFTDLFGAAPEEVGGVAIWRRLPAVANDAAPDGAAAQDALASQRSVDRSDRVVALSASGS